MNPARLLTDLGLSDVLDIAIVSVLLYLVFVALRRTRTTFLIWGLFLLGSTYVMAVAFDLRLTTFLYHVLFTVIAIGLVVIFHEEIRVSIERFFTWRRLRTSPARAPSDLMVQTLVKTLTDLARERIGALIVIRGDDDPARCTHAGCPLDGIVSEPLLKSIFDPNSAGHDGAVLIEGDRVTRFGCHLPLSTDAEQLHDRGTRHAAALGMSARTDGLCLVVSEERGAISIAREGRLEEVRESADLGRTLAAFILARSPKRPAPLWHELLTKHLALKVAAIGAAALLWVIVVREATVEYRSYIVPVEHTGEPRGTTVAAIVPSRVKIVVSGPRRTFFFVDQTDFRVVTKLFDLGPGQHEITITATDLTLPADLAFVNVVPRNVIVDVQTIKPSG